MAVNFVNGPFDYDGHVAACHRLHHWKYVLGVYDRWGQRVNSMPSVYCGPDPTVPANYLADFTGNWPGYTLALWASGHANPGDAPARLGDGPEPDAIHRP